MNRKSLIQLVGYQKQSNVIVEIVAATAIVVFIVGLLHIGILLAEWVLR